MLQKGYGLPSQLSKQVFCNLRLTDLHTTPERLQCIPGEQLDELNRHPKVTGARCR